MNKLYSVKQFSKLSGVSVRTLHYYDQIDLLKPSIRDKSNGYRMYQRSDLLKLEQIKVLKFIGYSLGQIKHLVAESKLDLLAMLDLHKQVINSQLLRLDNSLMLIKQMQESDANEVDWHNLAVISEGLTMQTNFDYQNWLKNYLNAEEMRQWQALTSEYPLDYWETYGKKWRKLFKEAEGYLDMDPKSAKVQDLCKRWVELVDLVYAKYPELRSKTWESFKVGIKSPGMSDYYNQAVIDFMDKAFKFYRN